MAGHTACDTSALRRDRPLPAPAAASCQCLPRLLAGSPVLVVLSCFSFSSSGRQVPSVGLIISASGLLLGQERGGSLGTRRWCLVVARPSVGDAVSATTRTGRPSGPGQGDWTSQQTEAPRTRRPSLQGTSWEPVAAWERVLRGSQHAVSPGTEGSERRPALMITDRGPTLLVLRGPGGPG